MFDFIWNLSAFIIAIGVLVTFHEFGHFYVARLCGVKVLRFSIGFGKPLWRKVDKLGTEYVIAAIPLGGYVKMLDERVEQVNEADKPYTFNNKNVYQRIAIIAAGPLANFLLAIVAYCFVFLIGAPTIKPVIGEVTPQSIAATANLPNKVEIVEVAGQRVLTWQDVNMALVAEMGSEKIDIKTKGFDSQYIATHTLNTKNWHYQPENNIAFIDLGIQPFQPQGTCIVGQVGAKTPAAQAGLQVGDKLVTINGQLLTEHCDEFTDSIQQLTGQQITLGIERNGLDKNLSVALGQKEINGKLVGYLGISRQFEAWPQAHQFELTYGLFDSLVMGLKKTWETTVFSFKMIVKLISGEVSVKNLSGPIGIAQGAGSSAGYGIVAFLGFIALFSINLGLFNLLPLPVLDGGHLVYYLIELFTGKPVPEKIQNLGFKIGAFALLSLMALALLNDISRL